MQVMDLSHHILIDTLTALAPTTLLSRWSTWKSAFEPFCRQQTENMVLILLLMF